MPQHFADALAAYTFPARDPHTNRTQDEAKLLRRIRRIEDETGERHPVFAPSAATMAELVGRPVLEAALGPVYRRAGRVLITASGGTIPHGQRVDYLRDALEALPDRPDLDPHSAYIGVRTLARHVDSTTYFTRYLGVIATAMADTGVFPPEPPKPSPRRPVPLTDQERKARSRERLRARRQDVCLAALRDVAEYGEDDLAPGARIAAPALYELAMNYIEMAADEREGIAKDKASAATRAEALRAEGRAMVKAITADAEVRAAGREKIAEADRLEKDAAPNARRELADLADDDGYPERFTAPTRNAFYATADDLLGPRRYVNGHRTYLIPADIAERLESPMPDSARADATRRGLTLDERKAELLARQRAAFSSGDRLAALKLHRERHALPR